MNKRMTKLSVASLVVTGSTLMMASAMADNGNYQGYAQGNYQGNAYGHQLYTPTATTTTAPIATNSGSQYSQYNYRNQTANRYENVNNGNHYGQYNNGNRYNTYNNGNHYGQYQNHYGTQTPVINGRPQYNYRNAYPTHAVYGYDRARDYRYGYLSRPQWYGRIHPHEYQVLRRDGRDFYYLQPAVYSTGVIVGRPQPGVVLMQYPDRTLEVIEATRLILDVLAR